MFIEPLTSEFEIQVYSSEKSEIWDSLIVKSLNGTFQQSRAFLNYHNNKFHDQSILITRKNSSIPVALMPAATQNSVTVSSHPGSAFGGLVALERLNLIETLEIFQLIFEFYRVRKFKEFRYRAVPRIFHQELWEEDLSALMILGASLNANRPYQYMIKGQSSLGKRRDRSSAVRAGCVTSDSGSIAEVHSIITQVLSKQHQTEPLHSIEDLEYLIDTFPGLVFLRTTALGEEIYATACLLRLNHVYHFQYLANTDKGRKVNAINNTIEYVWNSLEDNEILSFGHSMTPGANEFLNVGLAKFKVDLGAKSVPNYELSIKLESVC